MNVESMNLNELLNLKENQEIVFNDAKYEVLSKTVYVTESQDDEYVKYILTAHKILVVIPTDKIAYVGEIVEPFESEMQFSEKLIFDNAEFEKVASDYQLVKRVEFGNVNQVEGEVVWADYLSEAKPEVYISCAYVQKTKKRADIVAKIIVVED